MPLACVVAHAAIVVMLLIPVHTGVIDIASDVVLANADTHDILGTDVAYVIAHAAIVAMLQNTMTNPFFQFSCFEQFMLLCCHAVNSS